MSSKTVVDKLMDYLDNDEYISIEDAKEALEKVDLNGKTNNEQYKSMIMKVIKLINKRTDEVSDFIDAITSKKYSEEDRILHGYNSFPFQDKDINIDKLIIEKAFNVDKYVNVEDLICDLAYDEIDDLKPKIKRFADGIGIHFDNDEDVKQRNKKK